jgi:hypothetical protein
MLSLKVMGIHKTALGVCLFVVLAAVAATSDNDAAFIGARGKYWAFQKVERPRCR